MVQIMACHRTGSKLLSEEILVCFTGAYFQLSSRFQARSISQSKSRGDITPAGASQPMPPGNQLRNIQLIPLGQKKNKKTRMTYFDICLISDRIVWNSGRFAGSSSKLIWNISARVSWQDPGSNSGRNGGFSTFRTRLTISAQQIIGSWVYITEIYLIMISIKKITVYI